jgi:hypothetical protein
LGDFEPLGKRTPGHAAMGLQQQKRGEEPIRFQRFTSLLLFSFSIMTPPVINRFLLFFL